MTSRFTWCVIDCADPRRLATFWQQALGWEEDESDEDSVALRDPDQEWPKLLFQQVPEPKTVKNRLHLDVNPRGSSQEEELERLLSLGARRADIGQGADVSWVVLVDPEGNEFCLLQTQH
ncbi:MAG TPA: VOC family protein [Actinomycetota bacterium]|jgi:hypothetical protein|nr:VOC family protein [Actinomycetota bacterium]